MQNSILRAAWLCGALVLSACANGQGVGVESSRSDSAKMRLHAGATDFGLATKQLAELQEASNRLVRRSTNKGALVGAAAGCGLNAAIGQTSTSCLTGAVVGAAGGGIVGGIAGKLEVENRFTLVNGKAVAQDLKTSQTLFESVNKMLPRLLAEQEAELDALNLQLSTGQIDQPTYDAAVLDIRDTRENFAVALSLSARDARRTARNLRAAAEVNQADLDWHIQASDTLANQIEVVRSDLTLL